MGKVNMPPWAGMAELDCRTRTRRGETGCCWVPVADVVECVDGYVVQVELPGLSLDDVTVELKGRDLWVYGTTPDRDTREPERTRPTRYQLLERPRGPFARRFNLAGSIGRTDIRAVLKDGLLTVTLRKSPITRRTIPIED
jgi:Molecular chaperone (small heat shock protein)